MAESIITSVKEKVVSMFQDNWNAQLTYHDLQHTLTVTKFAKELAELEQIDNGETEILELATLLHDIGYLSGYFDHEDRGQEIANQILGELNYDPEKIKKVNQLIEATKSDHEPQTNLEEIIKDADLYNLASPEYEFFAKKLRTEWQFYLNNDVSDIKWFKENQKFLKNHEYFTKSAKELFSDQKEKNLKKLKSDRKELKKKDGILDLNKNKSAQMMFKTALRNHIDLTHIADNKANIMLTINSILITITMPLIATNIKNNPDLLFPTIILLVTSITSIVFATLVTRPVRTKGETPLDKISSGNTNLFFFGNFYKMPLPIYRSGMKEVINNPDILDHAIVNDLFYLGKALGSKFSKLRYCYFIFMIGMVMTVVSFFLTFLF